MITLDNGLKKPEATDAFDSTNFLGAMNGNTEILDGHLNKTIGGMNLIRNADFSQGLNNWEQVGSNWLYKSDTHFRQNIVAISTTTNDFVAVYQNITPLNIYNKYYTTSFFAYNSLDVEKNIVALEIRDSGNTKEAAIVFNVSKVGWNFYNFVFDLSDYNLANKTLRIVFGVKEICTFGIAQPQLQDGEIATSFNICPYDYQDQITSLETRLTALGG